MRNPIRLHLCKQFLHALCNFNLHPRRHSRWLLDTVHVWNLRNVGNYEKWGLGLIAKTTQCNYDSIRIIGLLFDD